MATKTGLPETREELVQMLIDRKKPQAVRASSGTCTYLHSKNGGCAIGVAVTEATAIKMEGFSGCSIGVAMNSIFVPKRLTKMGRYFLGVLQTIHDVNENWWDSKKATIGSNGLVWNDLGVGRINGLIKEYEINIKEISCEIQIL
jgi:hypothetical protein